MHPVQVEDVQKRIEHFAGKPVYIHLETTNGAYAAHKDEQAVVSGAYIRNAQIEFEQGKIAGTGPFRVGLKLRNGWVYAEGITHYTIDSEGRLLLAGHDLKGRLVVALELSDIPFS